MPNGHIENVKEWDYANKQLSIIDDQLKKVTNDSIQLIYNYHNQPVRILKWEENEIGKSIHITFNNKRRFDVAIFAYKDIKKERYWKAETVFENILMIDIKNEFENVIKKSMEILGNWSFEDLNKE